MADNEIRPECKVTFDNIGSTLNRLEQSQNEGFHGVNKRLDLMNGNVRENSRRINTLEVDGRHQARSADKFEATLKKLGWLIVGSLLVFFGNLAWVLIGHVLKSTGGP